MIIGRELFGGFGYLSYGFEGLGLVDGEFGQDLAVESDAGFLEATHESGVGHAEGADTGVDAGDPEAAEVALHVATVAVLVLEGLEYSLASLLDAGTTDEAIAFSLCAELLVFGVAGDAAFDSHYL